ncbi:unnamed protein product [Thlaspi arvense]|uniref:Uncharacterized protein n=1 Tax=Thlaspi arvense TaxID=13288 RepID=A0AAU9SNU0_THLAR|nr:unnamed protein product [Thlaspi arvense]
MLPPGEEDFQFRGIVNLICARMSDSGGPKTSEQESQPSEQESNSQQAMVKDVSTTVKRAVDLVNNAEAMSAESARIVEEVEAIVGIVSAYGPGAAADADPSSWDSVVRLVENLELLAASARQMAEKAADMMQDANAKTETARAEMAKALVVMKNVKWNV